MAVLKHSIRIAGHKTSISLEDIFWKSLREIADRTGTSPNSLVEMIDHDRKGGSLSSAIRVFVLGFYRDRSAMLTALENMKLTG